MTFFKVTWYQVMQFCQYFKFITQQNKDLEQQNKKLLEINQNLNNQNDKLSKMLADSYKETNELLRENHRAISNLKVLEKELKKQKSLAQYNERF